MATNNEPGGLSAKGQAVYGHISAGSEIKKYRDTTVTSGEAFCIDKMLPDPFVGSWITDP